MKTNGIKINGTIIEMDLSGLGPQEKVVFSNSDDTVLELSIDHNRNIQINEVDKEFPYSPYGDYENKENGDKGTVNAKFPPRSNGATEVGKSYISNLLRINECYFGGNVRLNNKAAATHNFVELANATDYNLSLNGLHLLYIPQDPTDNTWRHIALKGYIPAHGTYLIKGAKCGTPTIDNGGVSRDTGTEGYKCINNNYVTFENNFTSQYLPQSTYIHYMFYKYGSNNTCVITEPSINLLEHNNK